jgi:hypothetical protein
MSNWISTEFTKFENFFKTPAAQKVGAEINTLLPVAIGVVNMINKQAPNKTLSEINTIATNYALPTVTALENSTNGTTTGNVLLNLATQILQKNHAPQTAISTLNTVVQLALVAVSPSPALPVS